MSEEITFSKNRANGTVVKKKIPTFRTGGWKDWLQWSLHVQEYATFMGYLVDPDDQLALAEDIQLLLYDEDLRLFNDVVQTEAEFRPDIAYSALRQLTARHCPPGTRGVLVDEMRLLKKTRAMSVREYSSAFRTLLRMIPFLEHGENEPVPEADVVRMYHAGMPVDWQIEVNRISRTWDLRSVEAQFEVVERNERDEAILRNNRSHVRSQPQQHQRRNNAPNSGRGRRASRHHSSSGSRDNTTGNKYCAFCKRNNHNSSDCWRDPASPAYRPRTNHAAGGHREGNASMAAMQEQLNQMAVMMETMKRRQDEELAAMAFYSEETNNNMAAMSGRDSSDDTSDPQMEIQVKIGGKTMTALVDTGCTTSAMSQAAVAELGHSVVLQPEISKFRNADGTLGQTTHRIAAMLKLLDFSEKRTCSQQFRLAKTLLYQVMLGRDFLKKQKMILNFETCVMEWDGLEIPMQMRPRVNSQRRQAAVLQEDMECRAEIDIETQTSIPIEAMVDGHMLTAEEKIEVLELLHQYPQLFSGKLGTLRNKDPYVLPLVPDAEPVSCRPFPIPRAYYDATRREIQRLVDMGVLERDSSSAWGSPAFVIPKKDGSVRLVCDFRRLNKVLRRIFYPTKDVKQTLRSIEEPGYISTFDVPQSYYARCLARCSRGPTTIVLPWGKFVFTRLPMGVSTAPDEFQACMDEILGDLEFVRTYLDDIMVFSKTFSEHMEHLRIVFDRLQDAGLTLHPKKSKVCAEFVEYLGYQVSRHGISALPNKVEAIRALAAPRNRRDIRRFVGMVNYYRDMLPRRAALLSPLTRLTSPVYTFRWGDCEQTAFDVIKAALTEMVLLAYPKSGRPFHFYTDASKDQLGAVIMQDGQPIVFWSKKCNHTQALYPANRLELLSILLILREFRSTLLGQELHIHTDHLNLTYSTFHDVHIMRWRLEIEEYGPIIHYVSGSNNTVADALSRLPMASATGSTLEERELKKRDSHISAMVTRSSDTRQATTAEFNLDMHDLAAAQDQDSMIKKETKKEVSGVELWVTTDNKKIIVPDKLQAALVANYHEALIHPGADAMKATIGQVFHWNKMNQDIVQFCEKCLACAKAKHPTKKYGKLPEKATTVWPWFEIAADSIGPYGKHNFRALTIIDTSTRLLEVVPAIDGTSNEAAYLLDTHWLCRYPRPTQCIYDSGSEFRGEFTELLDSYGIRGIRTTVRNPQANSTIERVHRVIGEKMRTRDINSNESWTNFLRNLTFALRATHHSMTGASPSQQAFGRDMFVDMAHVTDWSQQHKQKLKQITANNERENSHRVEWTYRPTDQVLLRRDAGVQSKMLPLFDGPFEVIAVQDHGTLTLDKGRYTETVSIRRIRPYKNQRGGDCQQTASTTA